MWPICIFSTYSVYSARRVVYFVLHTTQTTTTTTTTTEKKEKMRELKNSMKNIREESQHTNFSDGICFLCFKNGGKERQRDGRKVREHGCTTERNGIKRRRKISETSAELLCLCIMQYIIWLSCWLNAYTDNKIDRARERNEKKNTRKLISFENYSNRSFSFNSQMMWLCVCVCVCVRPPATHSTTTAKHTKRSYL